VSLSSCFRGSATALKLTLTSWFFQITVWLRWTIVLVILKLACNHQLSPDRVVVLDEILQPLQLGYEVSIGESALIHIWPHDLADVDTIYTALVASKAEGMTVWLRSEIPSRLHYRNSPSIAPIVCVGDPGWHVIDSISGNGSRFLTNKGGHGYDPTLSDSPMRPFFLAGGPAFKKSFSVQEPFQNVNVYSLIAAVIGLNTTLLPRTSGSISSIRHLLRTEQVMSPELVNEFIV
jgi:hypothetical protein